MPTKNRNAAEVNGPERQNEPDAHLQPEEDDRQEHKLDEAAQRLIGSQLRAVYNEIVQQPVPDNLLELLAELERKEQR